MLDERGYRLSADVTTDWDRFQALVARADTQPAVEAMAGYRQALELVDGPPFQGALDAARMGWVLAEHLDMTISARIVDVAGQLANLALEHRDWDLAQWAVEKVLSLEPTREELYQAWMHAAGGAGRPGQVTDVYRRLCHMLQSVIDPLQEPSDESMQAFRRYTSGQAASR